MFPLFCISTHLSAFRFFEVTSIGWELVPVSMALADDWEPDTVSELASPCGWEPDGSLDGQPPKSQRSSQRLSIMMLCKMLENVRSRKMARAIYE